MVKAIRWLLLWLGILLALSAVLTAWAVIPRHLPGSAACPEPGSRRVVQLRKPRTLAFVYYECRLTSAAAAEIRGWYNTNPFAPIAGLEGFPRWQAGSLSFSIYQSLSIEPASLHQGGQARAGDRSAIVTESSYSFSW